MIYTAQHTRYPQQQQQSQPQERMDYQKMPVGYATCTVTTSTTNQSIIGNNSGSGGGGGTVSQQQQNQRQQFMKEMHRNRLQQQSQPQNPTLRQLISKPSSLLNIQRKTQPTDNENHAEITENDDVTPKNSSGPPKKLMGNAGASKGEPKYFSMAQQVKRGLAKTQNAHTNGQKQRTSSSSNMSTINNVYRIAEQQNYHQLPQNQHQQSQASAINSNNISQQKAQNAQQQHPRVPPPQPAHQNVNYRTTAVPTPTHHQSTLPRPTIAANALAQRAAIRNSQLMQHAQYHPSQPNRSTNISPPYQMSQVETPTHSINRQLQYPQQQQQQQAAQYHDDSFKMRQIHRKRPAPSSPSPQEYSNPNYSTPHQENFENVENRLIRQLQTTKSSLSKRPRIEKSITPPGAMMMTCPIEAAMVSAQIINDGSLPDVVRWFDGLEIRVIRSKDPVMRLYPDNYV